LAHKRLAIIDPEHGHQPMMSFDEELVITFIGQIKYIADLKYKDFW
jgi:asparagine synthase (glutamine-hydrolysing)